MREGRRRGVWGSMLRVAFVRCVRCVQYSRGVDVSFFVSVMWTHMCTEGVRKQPSSRRAHIGHVSSVFGPPRTKPRKIEFGASPKVERQVRNEVAGKAWRDRKG